MRCYFADGQGLQIRYKGCHGPLQWHHVIKQQRIRKEFPYGATLRYGALRGDSEKWRPAVRHEDAERRVDDILGDPRNRIWLCDRHHQFVTNARIYIPRSAMAEVEEFAKDYGLEGWLDK